ncbi:MAG TPA: hypothetical protein VN240_04650 [Propylenella sp.]|nr:hypothetical protein [Propylenella sp.]
MDLDDGGVDHGELHVWLIRAGLEKPNEHIGFDPITVSLELESQQGSRWNPESQQALEENWRQCDLRPHIRLADRIECSSDSSSYWRL